MRAILVFGIIVIAFLFGSNNAFADNIVIYGKSTYEAVGDKIIFGSLGDEYAVSEFGNLGGNDFIPENAFKNLLGYEGYSVAYDYNPTYDGYYDDFYKKPLPAGVDLTKIQIGGLGANPQELQDVYVLTSEYNRLNAEEQAGKIDKLDLNDIRIEDESKNRDNVLQDNLDKETIQRKSADNNLQKQINKNNKRDDRQDKKIQNNTNKINKETQQRKEADKKERTERIAGDKKLHKEIVNETKERKQADKEIRTDLKQETKDRKSADKTLQKNINTETKERKIADRTEKRERILGDKKLQDNINIVDSNSISRDTALQNNINSVNSRVNDVSNRVGKLEKTQVIAELGVRILDTKHLSVIPYLQQNFTRQKVSEVGVKCLIKIGKSYEEKLIEDTNSRVKELEKKMGGMPIITKVVDKKGKLISIRIEENGLSVGGEF